MGDVRRIVLRWYAGERLEENQVEIKSNDSWDTVRDLVYRETGFNQIKMQQIIFQSRDGVDFEKEYPYKDFFDAGDLFTEILLVDSTNSDKAHDFGRTIQPVLEVHVLESTLSHVRPVTAFMEAIENSIEAIRLVQRRSPQNYVGQVRITLNHESKEITIMDNGIGMTDGDMKNAVNYGRKKSRPSIPGKSDKEWQTGDFGKYGIGLFALFRFGNDVVIQIDSKREFMKQRMVSAVLNYKKMKAENKFEIEKISNPEIDHNIFPDGDSHGTRILIQNVSDNFWSSCTTATTREMKIEMKKEIAEKYYFYTNGMHEMKEAMKSIQNPLEKGMDTLPKIEIVIDDESIIAVQDNSVMRRIRRMFTDLMGTSDDSEHFSDRISAENGSISADNISRVKPCWYKMLEVETEEGHSADVVRATAHVFLYFNPIVSGLESSCNDQEQQDTQQILVFWQELFFQQEKSQLPFITLARQKAKKDKIPEDAFDRVKGFLFLDLAFAPDANKITLAKSGGLAGELFSTTSSSSCQKSYQKIVNDFADHVRKWHKEFDRMDIFKGPHVEVAGKDFLKWRSITKRQPGNSGPKSRMVEMEYKAQWSDPKQEGDFVDVVHIEDGRKILSGQICELRTQKLDGFYPKNGELLLMRPFQGTGLIVPCSKLVKKLDTSQVKALFQEIKSNLPNVLKINRSYMENGRPAKTYIPEKQTYTIGIEDAAEFQLTIEVKNKNVQLLSNVGLTRSQVLLPEDIVVNVALFLDREGQDDQPIIDQKTKHEWQDHVAAHDASKAIFNTNTSSTRAFTPLGTMLKNCSSNDSKFKLKVSVQIVDSKELDKTHKFYDELEEHLDGLSTFFRLEITAGKPCELYLTTERPLQIWFGVEILEVVLILKDRLGNVVPCNAKSLQVKCCCVSINGKDQKILELHPSTDNQQFTVSGLKIENGWKLKNEKESVNLKFTMSLTWGEEVIDLEFDALEVRLMSGLPKSITVADDFFDTRLSRVQKVKTKLKLTDAWGNSFRGASGLITATLKVAGKPWIRGRNGSEAVLPATGLVDGTVSIGEPSPFLHIEIHGQYGMKESITFLCNHIDHRREAFDAQSVDYEFSQSFNFEIENLQLSFEIPKTLSEKFRTQQSDGVICINVDHGLQDIHRTALHGILVKLKYSGSTSSFTKQVPGCDLTLQRLPLEGEENQSESGDGNTIIIDFRKGTSGNLDKHFLTNRSCRYVALFDGLQAILEVFVTAGKAHILKIDDKRDVSRRATVGDPFDILFKVLDSKDLPLPDISNYTLSTTHDASAALKLNSQSVTGDGRSRVASDGWFRLAMLFEGTLSQDNQRIEVQLSLQEKDAAQTVSRSSVKDTIVFQVNGGSTTRFRLLTTSGSSLPAEVDRGARLSAVVESVDDWDNVDTSNQGTIAATISNERGEEPIRKVAKLHDGKVEVTFDQWFPSTSGGKLRIEAQSGKKIYLEHKLKINNGDWPTKIKVVSPAEPCYLDDNQEILKDIRLQVLAEDGSIVAPPGFQVSMKVEGEMEQLAQQNTLNFGFKEWRIPKDPGEYSVIFVGRHSLSPSAPLIETSFKVIRTEGEHRFLEVVSGDTITATANTPQSIEVRVKNKLGAMVSWEDCTVRFSVDPNQDLRLEQELSESIRNQHVISFKEIGSASKIDRTIFVHLIRNNVTVSQEKIALHYIPQSIITQNECQIKRISDDINNCEYQKTQKNREIRLLEDQIKKATDSFQSETKRASIFSKSDVEKLKRCEGEIAKQSRTIPQHAGCLVQNDAFTAARKHKPNLKFVFELGRVRDARDGEAINALVGNRMLAAVTDTEEEKENIIKDRRLKGLLCVALENIRPPSSRATDPVQSAEYALQLVQPALDKYRKLWQELLRDALVFDCEEAMQQYKRQHGYARKLTAQRPDRTWRVVKSMWEVAGEIPQQYARLSEIPYTESASFKKAQETKTQLLAAKSMAEQSAIRRDQAKAAAEKNKELVSALTSESEDLERRLEELQAQLSQAQSGEASQVPTQLRRKRSGSQKNADGGTGGSNLDSSGGGPSKRTRQHS